MGGAAEMFAARFAPAIAGGGAVSIPSLTGAAGAFAALALASDADAARSAVLAVCPGLPDADALADDSDTSAVCSFGSTGWNTNLGTTYNAKTATRTNAPAAIKISGSFDFFFSAAGLEPPPEEA